MGPINIASIAFQACTTLAGTTPRETFLPENALQSLERALSQGNKGKAWNMLSKIFFAHKATLPTASAGRLLPPPPAALVLLSPSAPPALEKIELLEAGDNTARFAVVASQKSILLTTKKEADPWKSALNLGVSDE